MVRQRVADQPNHFAFAIQTQDGVKHIKIEYERKEGEGGGANGGGHVFSFSNAMKFNSLVGLVDYYRENDLGQVFNYSHMKGMRLRYPYKNA